MRINDKWIADNSSHPSRSGWTRAQLAVLGIPWPPPKGWRANLIGRLISEDTAEEFAAHAWHGGVVASDPTQVSVQDLEEVLRG
jgi:hypothetical protein